MTVNSTGLFNALVSHAEASGKFEAVHQHEPDNAPDLDWTTAFWINRIRPVQSSGLAATSAVFIFQQRLYGSGMMEPKDEIDPRMMEAIDVMMTAYSGDFEFDSALNVRCIDLLGMSGVNLDGQAGYVNSVEMVYRVFTIDIPIIVNDVWEQIP